MKKTIGIIGFGVVGQALAQGFSATCKVRAYDTKNEIDTFQLTVDESEYIFLCLPTPMKQSSGGRIDLKILTGAIEKIAKYLKYRSKKIIVIKSTVTPGTTRNFQKNYPKLNFVFNPEFLTERTARLDFINSSRVILGGKNAKDPNVEKIANLYRERFSSTPIIRVNYETAEFSKYLANTFFINKIMFFNEQKLVSEHDKRIDWYASINSLLMDGRVGNSHFAVPGHDGQLGFGGKCFPKDINAYRAWAKSIGASTPILDADWSYNKKIRKSWDWLEGQN